MLGLSSHASWTIALLYRSAMGPGSLELRVEVLHCLLVLPLVPPHLALRGPRLSCQSFTQFRKFSDKYNEQNKMPHLWRVGIPRSRCPSEDSQHPASPSLHTPRLSTTGRQYSVDICSTLKCKQLYNLFSIQASNFRIKIVFIFSDEKNRKYAV